MEVQQWLTIIGWPTSALLSLGVGVLIGKYNRPKRVLLWSEMDRILLFDEKTVRDASRAQIKMTVSNLPVTNISVVVLRIGNSGNQEIVSPTIQFLCSSEATVHSVRFRTGGDLFSKNAVFKIDQNKAELKVKHLNAGQFVDIEIVASNVHELPIEVDIEEAGVTKKKQDPSWWALPLTSVLGPSTAFSLSIMGVGVKFSPTSAAMVAIAEELQRIRGVLQSSATKVLPK